MKIVWIVGSSLIQNAFEHTSNRPTGANLGLEKYGVQLVWVGMRGMKWENLMSLISGLLNCYGLPHAIMIHCGGNDIGNSKTPCGLLIHQMKVAFAHILFELPGTAIIWSNIMPRLKWRTSPNVVKMNRTRKRVNRFARSHLLRHNCYILKHPDFDDMIPSLFADGVHLSLIGNDIFINSIQGALETFFSNPHTHIYPHD